MKPAYTFWRSEMLHGSHYTVYDQDGKDAFWTTTVRRILDRLETKHPEGFTLTNRADDTDRYER